MQQLDRIALRGLRGFGRHGVLASERANGQPFLIDVELGVDTRRAAKSDDLSDTVDYAGLADRVVALVEGEPVNLIETLAERIAAMCLEDSGVEQVQITVHKPEAPVSVAFEDVSVTIMRSRS
ncbi:dihydroneopterin aldolase [Sporichthya polymorpha]|uniref:dihydroneopterin aldolase n=1 Tax=Sporichthya polymorpha TaxID=35751 RepID=UPI0003814563|nr:dihydroneopterin aldolase [Sporichthya polymorpha]